LLDRVNGVLITRYCQCVGTGRCFWVIWWCYQHL